MAILICENCKISFKTYRLTDHGRKRKFCTWDCAMKAGWNTTNKMGDNNISHRPDVIEKMKKVDRWKIRGKNNYKWKGDNVGYMALHSWLFRTWGKPTKCEFCGCSGKKTKDGRNYITWANKSGKYKRIRNDWLNLCYRCHKQYDISK